MSKKLTYVRFVEGIALAISLLAVFIHVGKYTILTIPNILFYAWHVMIGMTLIFLYYPLGRKMKNKTKAQTIVFRVIDWLCIALTVGVSLYVILNFEIYNDCMQNNRLTDELFYLGIIITLLVLESGRRVLGNVLPIIAILAMLYGYFGNMIPGLFGHKGYKLSRIVLSVFSDRGVYGTPIGTSASNVYLFLLFAAYLNVSGADKIFQDIAVALAGRKRGGPAKMAVIASAFFGTISGSCVANVVSTGAFTIPLMKKSGYQSRFAGAVEAVSSTGGQIMPPIMGAAAFLMVEMAGESYAKIATSAILPACLYFTGIFIMVHLEAKRLGLKGLSRTELPKFWPLFIKNGYLLLPIVILVYMITSGYTMAFSAIVATAAAIVVSMFKKETRLTPKKFFDALENGTRSTLTVACACGVAGIIAGVITMTGLGQTLISAVVSISGGKIMIAMFLTMLCCIVLGMGVPTTANYVIMATTCAPILIKMGMVPLAAHFFVFYFGIIADITPPVALAAYAGSAIAGSRPMKTALNASMLAIAAFIIPYIFGLNPALLFIDASVFDVILIIITSFIGLFGVAVAVRGYLYDYLTWWQRVLSAAGGLLLIYPGLATDLIGAAIVAVGIGLHILSVRKKQAA